MNRALFIGRFQPFHNGHLEVIKHLSTEYDDILIGIGSAYENYTRKNPFTAGERFEMIEVSLRSEGISNYSIIPLPDINRYDIWPHHVQSLCPQFTMVYSNNPLIKELFLKAGYKVDSTELINRKEYSGSEIRRRILKNESWHDLVPPNVAKIMEDISGAERIRLIDTRDGG